MLVARLGDKRVEGWAATRGLEYRCPGCDGLLTVPQGRFVFHHFAHKPPLTCDWATGESLLHLETKDRLAKSFRQRGLRAEVEFIIDALPGDRRADVMVWSPKGQMVAFELQHTSIQLQDLETRAAAYARVGIAQMWIPFLRKKVRANAKRTIGGYEVERYIPRRSDTWIHGFGGGSMWMYDRSRRRCGFLF